MSKSKEEMVFRISFKKGEEQEPPKGWKLTLKVDEDLYTVTYLCEKIK